MHVTPYGCGATDFLSIPARHGDDDLAPGAAFVDVAERVNHLAQREASINRRLDHPSRDQLLQSRDVVRFERMPPEQ